MLLVRGRGPLVAIALIEHMGDIVAAEPIARYVRAMHPRAYVVWIVRPSYAEIPRSYPEIDQAICIGCLTVWMLLRKSRVFPDVFDLHISGRTCSVCEFPLLKVEGDPRISLENYFDYGNLLTVQCAVSGLPRIDDGPKIQVPKSTRQSCSALELPSRYIVLHCQSNEAVRDWDASKWTELCANVVRECKIDIVEVGLRPLLADVRLNRYRSLCGGLSILETAHVIKGAKLFIGVDSGPAHLANAVGTPGVVLLGSYRKFSTYMPFGGYYATGGADLLRAEGPVRNLPVEIVRSSVVRRITAN